MSWFNWWCTDVPEYTPKDYSRMSVRKAEPKDADNYARWLNHAKDINLLDRAVYSYPLAKHFVIERNGLPVLMNSSHPVVVMEALAPKPGISPITEARALNELFEQVKHFARNSNIKEVIFGCKDERLAKFIEGRGFERLNFPVFRFKL